MYVRGVTSLQRAPVRFPFESLIELTYSFGEDDRITYIVAFAVCSSGSTFYSTATDRLVRLRGYRRSSDTLRLWTRPLCRLDLPRLLRAFRFAGVCACAWFLGGPSAFAGDSATRWKTSCEIVLRAESQCGLFGTVHAVRPISDKASVTAFRRTSCAIGAAFAKVAVPTPVVDAPLVCVYASRWMLM